eukprot:scaffold29885_cov118-Isochrysis_galbana.AAC.1
MEIDEEIETNEAEAKATGCGIGWSAKRGVGRVTSKGATLARTRTRSHVCGLWTRSVHDRPRVSESALCEGRSPVWPWSGARCLASCVPGASCSRA